MQSLELDCEKRAVKLLDKWNIDYDKTLYIRGANAYMYFFEYLKITRQWCHPYNTPSTNEQLLAVMPSTFLGDYTMTDLIKNTFINERI